MPTDLSYNPQAVVRPFLQPDEPILWCGQPYTTVTYRPPVYSTFFAVFWFGFALFWTVMASAAGAFALFGLPFLGIGVYLLYTLLIGTRNRMRNTVYAVTDRRALILTVTPRGTNCTDHVFAHMTGVSLTDIRGTAGTIRFVPEIMEYGYYHASYHHRRRGVPISEMGARGMTTSFLMIEDVQSVYRLISEQMTKV